MASELFKGLPDQQFSTLTIDPPWQITLTGKWKAPHGRAEKLPYRTLTLKEIQSFPVADLARPGCHVYLWATNKTLPDAFDVLSAWGVNYHLTMVWSKTNGIAPCNGYVFATEFCLLGFFGRPMLPFTHMGRLNWLTTSRRKHSEKPNEFYKLVAECSPGPRLDCFSRQHRPGFLCWGDEAPVNEKGHVS